MSLCDGELKKKRFIKSYIKLIKFLSLSLFRDRELLWDDKLKEKGRNKVIKSMENFELFVKLFDGEKKKKNCFDVSFCKSFINSHL